MAYGAIPQKFEELADLIGWPNVQKLIEVAGGQRRIIPATASDEHWLTFTIGRDATDRLCKVYGGSLLDIPRDVAAILRRRNSLISADRTAGMTIRALAAKWILTERQIYNILGSLEN